MLIVAGGIVTTRGAGLAVPDWPLSYGTLMPERWYAMPNIAAEHSHRMIAGAVALMMTVLAVCVQVHERRRWVKVLGWTALGLVIGQALLGGATVLMLGPHRWIIRIIHAFVAQSFFAMTIALAASMSEWWGAMETGRGQEAGGSALESDAGRGAAGTGLRGVSTIALVALLIQLMLGAAMRHTESGTALLDFPRSFRGAWLPPGDAAGLAALNEFRFEAHELADVSLGQVWINFAHRLGAVASALAVIALLVYTIGRHADEPALILPAMGLTGLFAAQVALGIMTVLTVKNVWITTVHVATGVLMLGMGFLIALRAFRLKGVAGGASIDRGTAGERSAVPMPTGAA